MPAPQNLPEALADLGNALGREAVKMTDALQAPHAFRKTAEEALRLREVLRPPRYRQIVIFGRSFDANLVVFGAFALAGLLYGGL